MKIGLVAFDDFTDIDLILHWDLLNRVKQYKLHPDWQVQILGTKKSHLSVNGLEIATSGPVDLVAECDAVLVTSGIGTRKLLQDADFLRRMKVNPERQLLAAQCSGSLVFGELGLLQGVRVSAYPPIAELLKNYGAELVAEAFVKHGKLATASSCLAGQYLSNWIIETLAGQDAANKVMDSVRPLGLQPFVYSTGPS